MTRHWRVGQRGSITPFYLGLFGVVFMLLLVFVDREWLNYNLRLAEQAADVAAEAAAGNGSQIIDTIRVQRVQRHYWEENGTCAQQDAAGNCIRYNKVQRHEDRYDFVPLEPTEREVLRKEWTTMAECGGVQDEPNWRCAGVEVLDTHVQHTANALTVGRFTFESNWLDRQAAFQRDVDVQTWPANDARERLVRVTVQLEVRSLFGLPWTADGRSSVLLSVVGQAATVAPPLELILPTISNVQN